MAEAALAVICVDSPVQPDDWGRIARELGWDHARHGVTPPPEHLALGHPLRTAWQDARRHLGRRPPASGARGAAVQDWLSLRLAAWLRGVPVQALTVTPHHLGQLQVSHCPVTREALTRERGSAGRQPVVVRLCGTAAFAAGHLAMLGRRAADALGDRPFDDLAQRARDDDGMHRQGELTTLHWGRLAVLRSFVTPLPHAQAATLPLLVLPPNRVRVRNPIQALQVLLTLMLAKSGWSKQLPALQALLPDAASRRELQTFFMCLMARAIAAGRPGDAQAQRWALEDAWRHPSVLAHWRRFALRLDEGTAQSVVERALAAGLAPKGLHGHSDEQATEGWSMADACEPADAPLPTTRTMRHARQAVALRRPLATPRQMTLLMDE